MFSLSLCYFGTKILAISCFYCLQNDDVIEFALLCQFCFEFLTIIKMGIINDLCIPHFSIIFYFVTKILAI